MSTRLKSTEFTQNRLNLVGSTFNLWMAQGRFLINELTFETLLKGLVFFLVEFGSTGNHDYLPTLILFAFDSVSTDDSLRQTARKAFLPSKSSSL